MVDRKSGDSVESKSFSSVDVLLVVMSFVWGLNFTIIKSALNFFQPLSFNALRFGLASILLLFFLKLMEKNLKIQRTDVKRFIILALIGNTLYQILFINGIFRTTAGNSSLILATTPIFVAMFNAYLGIEKVERRIWQSVIISFTGIALIVLGSGKPVSFNAQTLQGDILILACTICWSAYTVLSKPLLKRYSPLKLVSLTVAMGTPPLIALAAPSMAAQKWKAIPLEAWLGLAYSACLAVAIGYAIWYTGVSRIGSAKTALYEYLITIIAIAASWILLGETMSSLQLMGAILVFIGLYLPRKIPKTK